MRGTAWKVTALERSLSGKGKSEGDDISELFQGDLQKSTDPVRADACLDSLYILDLCLLVQVSINKPRKKGSKHVCFDSLYVLLSPAWLSFI